jgi:hypothetical protein
MVVRALLSCANGSYTMANRRGLGGHEKLRCRYSPSGSPKTRMSQVYTGVDNDEPEIHDSKGKQRDEADRRPDVASPDREARKDE